MENTIDFLVKFNETPAPEQRVDLYVGHRVPAAGGGKVSCLDFTIRVLSLTSSASSSAAAADPVAYTQIPFVAGNDESLSWSVLRSNTCLNGDRIEDGAIVEFMRDHDRRKWIPTRVRRDKHQPNDYATAVNVWRSITTERVEVDVIRGDVNIQQHPASSMATAANDDIYYAKRFSRDRSATRTMLLFHNTYVKRWLLDRFGALNNARRPRSIFDFACGKGGDIIKFLDSGFNVIVGADKSVDNIENVSDGACARVLDVMDRRRRSNGRLLSSQKPKIALVPGMDLSRRIDSVDIMDSITSEEGRALMKYVWDGKLPSGLSPQDRTTLATSQLGNLRRFDVVWCSFALHYFFESKKTVETFVYNVDQLLKDGGYFVGTFLDGRQLDKAFEQSCCDHIKGTRGGRVLWSIKKQYDGSLSPSDLNANIGKRITVFMETINKPIDEFLVDPELLVAALREKGIELLSPEESVCLGLPSCGSGSFKEVFDMHHGSSLPFDRDVAQTISADEQRYSFMNRWFVFIKRAAVVHSAAVREPDLPSNEAVAAAISATSSSKNKKKSKLVVVVK